MDDFTKIKLINSLIDVVNEFYELKQKEDASKIKHLKGFCEGLAFALTKMQIIESDEAKKILQGLGKKREILEETLKEPLKEDVDFVSNDLEVPTVFRQKKDLTPD